MQHALVAVLARQLLDTGPDRGGASRPVDWAGPNGLSSQNRPHLRRRSLYAIGTAICARRGMHGKLSAESRTRIPLIAVQPRCLITQPRFICLSTLIHSPDWPAEGTHFHTYMYTSYGPPCKLPEAPPRVTVTSSRHLLGRIHRKAPVRVMLSLLP